MSVRERKARSARRRRRGRRGERGGRGGCGRAEENVPSGRERQRKEGATGVDSGTSERTWDPAVLAVELQTFVSSPPGRCVSANPKTSRFRPYPSIGWCLYIYPLCR